MLIRSLALAAGLALVAMPTVAQDAPDWSKAQTIQIAMSNYAFSPATLQLRANTPYTLVFADTVTKSHNFSAPELFASGVVAPQDQAKVVKGEVEVEDGGTVSVHFMPQHAGTYKFACTHFMHSMLGMTGQAVVQ